MKTYPYIIRLAQLITDLPDFADEIRVAHENGESALPEETRVGLAHTVALRIGNDGLTHSQLNDPATGVAVTQKALQDLINQGYRTLYSPEALTIHALDVRFQQGHISETDAPKYAEGTLDPTDHILAVIREFDFQAVESATGGDYYLSPRF